jgi:hypothetical protein
MKKAIPVVVLLITLSLSVVSAVSLDAASIQSYVDSYNGKIDNAPDVLKGMLGNEQVNVDITRNDGSIFQVGFDVKNAHIDSMVEGGLSDPSIVLTTTESAIANIKGSDDPITAFQNQMDLGQVRIEGENYIAKAKIAAVLSSGGVLQFFYNVFFG